jgi:hypothetical protein
MLQDCGHKRPGRGILLTVCGKCTLSCGLSFGINSRHLIAPYALLLRPDPCDAPWAFIQTYTAPGIVDLYQNTNPLDDPAFSGQITLSSGEDYPSTSVADLNYAYFGTGTAPGRVVRVHF